ncbi:salt tolerance down-regulator-domain-containing protein [Xylariaceae sp. FL0255]|nr:salt tolerance down-regulator-domain-containing protein [Xylariaceae sp. FL0255]
MPSNNNRPPAPAPAPATSPNPKATAKYTNKDGTKYISVPKSSASTPPAQPSPTTTISSRGGAPTHPTPAPEPPAPVAVNKKKQKRRAKAAAKAAAAERDQAAANGLPSPASTASVPQLTTPYPPRANPGNGRQAHSVQSQAYNDDDWGEETESDDGHKESYSHPNQQHSSANDSISKSKKQKKKKKAKMPAPNTSVPPLEHSPTRPSGISREKIWNTSGPEERERIKQFWLGLGEDERKSLVKVEKDAVLRKMKEQQKHTCSCTVCGRKRTAIEEELEGLYDAYYQELESFANQPHSHPNGPPMFGPKRFGPMSGLHPPGIIPSQYPNHHPSRGRIVEHVDNDEDDDELDGAEEEYSDEEDLDDDEEEDEPEEPRDSYSNDFFNFGQSLTVKGGILTVADDLLKNDGKKFIEMMEQLAERRMAREEDAAHYTGNYGHAPNGGLSNSHNHPPPEEEEYDDEDEDEEEYDESQEDDEYEEEEDQMTEEQRMEEGRRMFQIFAARMFEQRVLTAYREKVAKERQEKLLEELAQEETQESQRKAKKAVVAQKRKEKALQKKQAALEEKQKREAEKAAEEEAKAAEEARRNEEARAKAEERRRKKEAQKKAEEEERLRKEAEKQRRAHEQKEKQAEQERKAREAKEREKRVKEEQRRKEQEAREAKERETRERREKHEKDKREKESRAAQAKAEREAKEKSKLEEKTASKPAVPIPIPPQPPKKQLVSVPALPQQPLANNASPQIAVAKPALPITHTPVKPRAISQDVTRSVSQASHSASGPSQTASPHAPSPLQISPGPVGSLGKSSIAQLFPPMSPHHSAMKSPPGLHPGPFDTGIPPMPMQIPPGMPPVGHAFNRMPDHMFPPMGSQFRAPGMSPPPPGLGGPMGGQGFHPSFPPGAMDMHMPTMHQPFSSGGNHPGGQQTHSRQGSASYSASFDLGSSGGQPIGRPAPIGRPDSTVNGQRRHNLSADIDDVGNQLGSSALLDDNDEPLPNFEPPRQNTVAPGVLPRPAFPNPSFASPPYGPSNNLWGAPGVFTPPPGFSHPVGNAGWLSNPAFGMAPPTTRISQPRPLMVRQLVIRACKELENYATDAHGYIELPAVRGHIDTIKPVTLDQVSEDEILEICETEGNSQNGGGSFDIRHSDGGKVVIRFDGGVGAGQFPRNVGAPGEIGSPHVASGTIFRG